jgi:hypothetical protein
MLRHFPATVLAAALFLPMPALASDTTGQPGRGGDGHCPIPELATDPDCAREGSQQLSKSSRDEFPDCMNGTCTNRRSTAVVAGRHQGDQFPGNRQGGGSGPALPAPRAV